MYVCLSVHDPPRAQQSSNHANTILANRGEHPGLMISPALRRLERAYAALKNTNDVYAPWPKPWPTMPLPFLSYFYAVLYSMTARIIHCRRSSPHTAWAAMGCASPTARLSGFPPPSWGLIQGPGRAWEASPTPCLDPHAQAISLGESGGRSGQCRVWARAQHDWGTQDLWARYPSESTDLTQECNTSPGERAQVGSLRFGQVLLVPRSSLCGHPPQADSACSQIRAWNISFMALALWFPLRPATPRLPRAPVRSGLHGQAGAAADFPVWFLQIQARGGSLLLLLLVCLVFRKSEFIKEGAAPNFYHFPRVHSLRDSLGGFSRSPSWPLLLSTGCFSHPVSPQPPGGPLKSKVWVRRCCVNWQQLASCPVWFLLTCLIM